MKFTIKTQELWSVDCEYDVVARTREEALEMVKRGEVAISDYNADSGYFEILEVLSVEEV